MSEPTSAPSFVDITPRSSSMILKKKKKNVISSLLRQTFQSLITYCTNILLTITMSSLCHERVVGHKVSRLNETRALRRIVRKFHNRWRFMGKNQCLYLGLKGRRFKRNKYVLDGFNAKAWYKEYFQRLVGPSTSVLINSRFAGDSQLIN